MNKILVLSGIVAMIIVAVCSYVLGTWKERQADPYEKIRDLNRSGDEMCDLIMYGADAFTAWMDSEKSPDGKIRVSDSDDPFGKETGWMLQALSRMNDYIRRSDPPYTYRITNKFSDVCLYGDMTRSSELVAPELKAVRVQYIINDIVLGDIYSVLLNADIGEDQDD